jgi:hypothetical protein
MVTAKCISTATFHGRFSDIGQHSEQWLSDNSNRGFHTVLDKGQAAETGSGHPPWQAERYNAAIARMFAAASATE